MATTYQPIARILTLGILLSASGCSTTHLTQDGLPSGMDAHQFRQQYMELYRTQEAMPQLQPILTLKPTPKS